MASSGASTQQAEESLRHSRSGRRQPVAQARGLQGRVSTRLIVPVARTTAGRPRHLHSASAKLTRCHPAAPIVQLCLACYNPVHENQTPTQGG